jgi:large subunit ribosomal protein L11
MSALVRRVRLRVNTGVAKPGPAIGQALGPLGINMAEFCKQFNDKSLAVYNKDIPVSVLLNAYADRSFSFVIRSPPTSYLIKQVTGMKQGPKLPTAASPVATISPEAVYEIARIKQRDDHRHHLPLEGIARSVIGSCHSMGVVVVDENNDDENPVESADEK